MKSLNRSLLLFVLVAVAGCQTMRGTHQESGGQLPPASVPLPPAGPGEQPEPLQPQPVVPQAQTNYPQSAAEILREHAVIGHAYGQQGLAHDIRLACHGLDAKDNELVLGLVSRELHPLSHLVQAMRKTKQTSEYIEQMGPFFVGYVTHRVTG